MGALKGPAEEEVALVNPDVFDHPDGVARLIALFEDPCKEELVVRQSVAINNYEALVRKGGQSMTKYITAWRQAEIKLRDALIPAYPGGGPGGTPYRRRQHRRAVQADCYDDGRKLIRP